MTRAIVVSKGHRAIRALNAMATLGIIGPELIVEVEPGSNGPLHRVSMAGEAPTGEFGHHELRHVLAQSSDDLTLISLRDGADADRQRR